MSKRRRTNVRNIFISGGVERLQTNFYIDQFRELAKDESKLRQLAGQDKTSVETCNKHVDQPLFFYCEECRIPICSHCTVIDHKESDGHSIVDLEAANERIRNWLHDQSSGMEAAVKDKEAALELMEMECANLERAKDVALKRVDQCFENYQHALDTRRQNLRQQINRFHADKSEQILKILADTQIDIAYLRWARKYCDQATLHQSYEFLSAMPKSDILLKADNLAQSPLPDIGSCNFVQFSQRGDSEFRSAVDHLGRSVHDQPLPNTFEVYPETAAACLRSLIIIRIRSFRGELLRGCPIEMRIKDPEGHELEVKIRELGNGRYLADYMPRVAGRHRAVLYFLGREVKETKQRVNVRTNVAVISFGEKGTEFGQFKWPKSICTGVGGRLVVADCENQRIQTFTDEGKYVSSFSVAGADGKYSTIGIAMDINRNEIICPQVFKGSDNKLAANSVQIFSHDGEMLERFSSDELRKGCYAAVNSRGEIIIADSQLCSLLTFSRSGETLKRIGSRGQGPLKFSYPTFVAVGRNDDILVVDSGAHLVQIISRDGKFKYQIGGKGRDSGRFVEPSGIAVDSEHRILVGDSGNNRIQIFKYDGTFIGAIQDLVEGQFRGLAVLEDNHVVAVDRDNHCLRKYAYMTEQRSQTSSLDENSMSLAATDSSEDMLDE